MTDTVESIMALADAWYAHGQMSHSGVDEKYAALRAAVERLSAGREPSPGGFISTAAEAADRIEALERDGPTLTDCFSVEGGEFVPCTMREAWEAAQLAARAEAHYADEMRRKYDEALALLHRFYDIHNEPCRLDHHGYCQAHFLERDGCTVKATRELLARIDAAMKEAK